MKNGAIATLLALAVLAAGCGQTSESSGANPLAHTTWEVTSFDDSGTMKSPDPTTMITASFGLTDLNGSTGDCNLYTIPYSIDGSSLGFGSVSLTGAACPEPDFSPQADSFIRALEGSETYELAGNVLEIYDGDGQMMLALRPADPLPLTGISWRLTSFRADGGLTSPLSGSTISLNFLADGTLTGIAGCNSYFADYLNTDPGLAISNLAYTEMGCTEPAGVMEQEAAYLALLGGVDTHQTDLTGLTLLRFDGEILAEFQFAGRVR
jgi:heat shock protein HslJ